MSKNFDELVQIMQRLRGPHGCPWDHEQSHQSLIPYLIEEAYEVIEAIQTKDTDLLREELGDLILQVVFHAQIAKDKKKFTIDDVLKDISEKLIRRHPHVFGNTHVNNADEVSKNWDAIKATEKNKLKQKSYLDSVPKALPALFESFKLTKKASKVGFDWTDAGDVLDKIEEEIAELKDALKKKKKSAIEHEMGDVFFSLTNLCRKLKVNPELAVNDVNQRFRKRFAKMEQLIKKKKLNMNKLSTDQWESLWVEAKRSVK